ncbi:MAG: polysaccharide deacetylase family protein [Parvibaculaceae bacterium]
MAGWDDLGVELARWVGAGRTATLWWRDDDAADRTPAVERLVGLAEASGAPVHLAVVPAPLTERLTAYLMRSAVTRVLQHGYAHANYAPKGTGKWELGDHRPLEAVLAELDVGRRRLAAAFGKKFLPVLVPPWTRISDSVTAALAAAGFEVLSTEGARADRFAAPGLLALHAHCDPIRWKGGAQFRGEDRSLALIVEHLAARREGRADLTEPTGLCTHHLALDGEGWEFVERLLQYTVEHRAVRWIALEDEMDRDRQ